LTAACRTPPVPSEVEEAIVLEQDLGRAGGSLFFPAEVEAYRLRLIELKAGFEVERAKFAWFRDYGPIQASFRRLLEEGGGILERVASAKNSRSDTFKTAARELEERVARLKAITGFFNENEAIRPYVTQAEIKLAEARLQGEKENYPDALKSAAEGMSFVEKAREAAGVVLARYLDPDELARWRRQAEDTVAATQAGGKVAFVVNKIERTLTVYRRGKAVASFGIGLGRFGLSDKLFSGDEATPEGQYRVVQKFPNSTFYKALLINYPNDLDRQEFAAAKRRGAVPEGATIGGAIEIHGGGRDNLTMGCVGLENGDMDEVFRWAEIGTPVTIVGALTVEGTILEDLRKFGKNG
jgi:L,D-peptidoglycan transpeptidase YkuD (ErfK/YbiS/YcfS/YnhG family)